MLLTIDIGNTNITLGVFDGPHLKSTWRIATDQRRLTDEYGLQISALLPLKGVAASQIDGAGICSVAPILTPTFEEMCRVYFNVDPLTVSAGVKTGVRILYDSPRDVGADRIVDAAAAYRLYGGPAIMVDFGTATVFDAVTKDGEYLGGAIAPGIHVAADALFLSTSQLRRVDLATPAYAIGRNTVMAPPIGTPLGTRRAGGRNGLPGSRLKLGQESRVIATGGLAEVIARETDVFDEINMDLTLIGLRLIYDMNRGSNSGRED